MTEVPLGERVLLAKAERRLGRHILLLAPVGSAGTAWWWGWFFGISFAMGGLLAYLNYRWIVAVVDALVRAQSSGVPRRVYLKLFLPVTLLGAVLYVIFSRSWLSVPGFLAGLSLLVVGVVIEAMWQVSTGVGD